MISRSLWVLEISIQSVSKGTNVCISSIEQKSLIILLYIIPVRYCIVWRLI
nr:MAG TPA: hypothetical protein [Bacteriophage sp.]